MAEPNISDSDTVDFSIFDAPEGTDVLAEPATSEDSTPVTEDTTVSTADEATAVEDVLTEADAPEEKDAAADAAVTPKTVKLGDEDLVTILQDGKEVSVPWKDYKGHVMRQADYTRKLQKVSTRESEIEDVASRLNEREAKLLDIVSDPDKLAKLYTHLTKRALVTEEVNAPAAPSADELVTHGDIQQTKEQLLSELREEAKAEVLRVQQEQENARAERETHEFVTHMRSTTEETLDAVLKDHEATLGNIPFVDAVIKKMAWNDFQPKTLDEMKHALIESGKKLAAQFGERDREQKKADAVKKVALAKGIEPAGGKPPGRAPKTYETKDGKADWDDLDRDVVNWINSRKAA